MLQAGKYRAIPVEAALGMTKTGKEQIAILFETLDPPGEKITWYGFFTDETYKRTIESLRACGWTGTNLDDFWGMRLPAEVCKEVQIVVEEDEMPYNDGRPRMKVRWVNSGGGLAMKDKLDEGHAKTFAAQMRGKIVALGLPQPSQMNKPAAVAASPAAEVADDEIPF
jgi:hypothetical protein